MATQWSTTTWGDLIALAFRDSGVFGVGQTAQAQDTTDAVRRLNLELQQWKSRRWMDFVLVEKVVTCDGSLFYTIGDDVSADINYPRPAEIKYAFVRQINPAAQPNQPDFPLRIIRAREEYSQITLKQLQAGPAWALFYESSYEAPGGLGKLYAWPLMSNQYELHVGMPFDIVTIGTTSDVIFMPPEYGHAIYAKLKQQMRTAYDLPPRPDIDMEVKVAYATIRSSNFQIPTLNMPLAVQNYGGGYNIFSDSWGPWAR